MIKPILVHLSQIWVRHFCFIILFCILQHTYYTLLYAYNFCLSRLFLIHEWLAEWQYQWLLSIQQEVGIKLVHLCYAYPLFTFIKNLKRNDIISIFTEQEPTCPRYDVVQLDSELSKAYSKTQNFTLPTQVEISWFCLWEVVSELRNGKLRTQYFSLGR